MRPATFLPGLLLAGLALSASAPPARAGLDIRTQTVTTTPIPLTKTDWNDSTASLAGKNPFVLPQFNPADHTAEGPPGSKVMLLAVAFELTYQFQNTLTMQFTNVSTITVTASGIMHLNLPGVINDLVGAPTFANSGSRTSKSTDTFPENVVLGPQITSGDSKMAYFWNTSPNVTNAFTGTGVIKLPVIATATSDFTTSSGNGRGTSDTFALASINVIYFYTFVPEPSSVVLTALGGTALAACYQRRRARSSARAA
jgi:hypothetical protein